MAKASDSLVFLFLRRSSSNLDSVERGVPYIAVMLEPFTARLKMLYEIINKNYETVAMKIPEPRPIGRPGGMENEA